MEKKVLIAVDGSHASERAVDYVGFMAEAMITELKVCLYYAMTPIPPFMRREGQSDPSTYRRLKAMEKKYKADADQVLGQAKERLLQRGMAEEKIQLKAVPRTAGTARDILFEAEQGLYDAVVLGRRGLSKAQELFMGSVTTKVVQHASTVPVWLVGGHISSAKVLCAVDGSEGSLKAVDHMAFMLGGRPETKVTLFHVGATLANYCPLSFDDDDLAAEIEGDLMTSDAECMDDFYARALKVLLEGGLERDQVETVSREKMGVAGAILEMAQEGEYGTIVLGRRGHNRSFFLGHVSDKIVARSEHAAVWVVG